MDDFQNVLSKLLKSSRLQPPFKWDDSPSYRSDLTERLENFNRRIKKFQGSGEVESYLYDRRDAIRVMSSVLIQVLDEYLSGSTARAYSRFEEFMDLPIVKENLSIRIKDLKSYSNSTMESMFRVRLSEGYISERKDLFHIPFESRHIVDSKRYSIAGLPCLYLGSSIYVCWQEMGKPDLNKLYISRYQTSNKESIKVLDFAYSLEALKRPEKFEMAEFFTNSSENQNTEDLASYVIMYPLLLSCSYNRAFEDASFNVEYVISNLLLQWISREKYSVSGIAYFSTKTKQLRHSKLGINYVFPPDTNDLRSSGYCQKLQRTFRLTKPISWQLLDAVDVENRSEVGHYPRFDDVDSGFLKHYKITKFYQAEQRLRLILEDGELDLS